jgi:hypothetical protein
VPQLQLPVFPEGVTHLTPQIAFVELSTVHQPVDRTGGEQGPKGFFRERRDRCGGVLKGETHQKAQALLDAGHSVPAVGRELAARGNSLSRRRTASQSRFAGYLNLQPRSGYAL